MGAFKIEILGVGGHGCERKAKAGDKLYGRCGRYNCPDCIAFEFTQQLKMKGMVRDGDSAVGQEVVHSAACPAPMLEENKGDCTCGAIPAGAEVYHVDGNHQIVPRPVEGGKTYWRIMQHATFTHWPYSTTEVVDDMLKNERAKGQF